MEESILTSIKKLLGIMEDYTSFDTDIIFDINSALFTLNQLGVGKSGFAISDATSTWDDFLEQRQDVQAVVQYIYLNVKLVFDPPTSSFVVEAMNNRLKELEWRLNVQVDDGIADGTT